MTTLTHLLKVAGIYLQVFTSTRFADDRGSIRKRTLPLSSCIFTRLHPRRCSSVVSTLYFLTVNLQLNRGDKETWSKEKQEEANQPQVLFFHPSPPLLFDLPYYISIFAIGQNSPKTWCFCRPPLVTQMHFLWFSVESASFHVFGQMSWFSSCVWSFTVFCFIISQQDVV